MHRAVEPELLDELPPADPLARGSRSDLRRINWLMGHAGLITNIFRPFGADWGRNEPLRIVELGAGDGTFLLSLARRWSKLGLRGQVTLVDRQNSFSEKTKLEFHKLDWTVTVVVSDVFEWLARPLQRAHLILCNLFLHHFNQDLLESLLRRIAAQAELFIGCEHRRSALALTASRLLRFIGCNSVTRHDAAVSVRAGFSDEELSRLWPGRDGWILTERSAGLFSHCFVASRHE